MAAKRETPKWRRQEARLSAGSTVDSGSLLSLTHQSEPHSLEARDQAGAPLPGPPTSSVGFFRREAPSQMEGHLDAEPHAEFEFNISAPIRAIRGPFQPRMGADGEAS